MSLLLVAEAAALVAAGGIAFAPVGFFGGSAATTVVKLAHLLCFATSWGATVCLHRRHHHVLEPAEAHDGRRKVFPACFRLTAACTAASAAAFAWLHLPWRAASPAERRQLVVLAAAAGLDLANLLVFTPKTIEGHLIAHLPLPTRRRHYSSGRQPKPPQRVSSGAGNRHHFHTALKPAAA
ncbi:hypothetical protein C2845_PM06G31010 [Panicum miliaceum]|uniref:TMEM205-like domain-containing protein n=1 Tax=Panicum miliaceum TaxID=4540 RepID=A0A3L6RBT2_PANMI|nr:hypothetical protein C2845_PM06G31010 [Panicum miliaceum]